MPPLFTKRLLEALDCGDAVGVEAVLNEAGGSFPPAQRAILLNNLLHRGRGLLAHAAAVGDAATCSVLLRHGVAPDSQRPDLTAATGDRLGHSFGTGASSGGSSSSAEHPPGGGAPLHYAAAALHAAGAGFGGASSGGRRAAALEAVVGLLLGAGADGAAENTAGHTPLDLMLLGSEGCVAEAEALSAGRDVGTGSGGGSGGGLLSKLKKKLTSGGGGGGGSADGKQGQKLGTARAAAVRRLAEAAGLAFSPALVQVQAQGTPGPSTRVATDTVPSASAWRRVWLVAMPRRRPHWSGCTGGAGSGGSSSRQQWSGRYPGDPQLPHQRAARQPHGNAGAAVGMAGATSGATLVGCDLLGFALAAEGEEAGGGSSSTEGRGGSSSMADTRYARLLFRLRLDPAVAAAAVSEGGCMELALSSATAGCGGSSDKPAKQLREYLQPLLAATPATTTATTPGGNSVNRWALRLRPAPASVAGGAAAASAAAATLQRVVEAAVAAAGGVGPMGGLLSNPHLDPGIPRRTDAATAATAAAAAPSATAASAAGGARAAAIAASAPSKSRVGGSGGGLAGGGSKAGGGGGGGGGRSGAAAGAAAWEESVRVYICGVDDDGDGDGDGDGEEAGGQERVRRDGGGCEGACRLEGGVGRQPAAGRAAEAPLSPSAAVAAAEGAELASSAASGIGGGRCALCLVARPTVGFRHGGTVHCCACRDCAAQLLSRAAAGGAARRQLQATPQAATQRSDELGLVGLAVAAGLRCPLCRQGVEEVLQVYGS